MNRKHDHFFVRREDRLIFGRHFFEHLKQPGAQPRSDGLKVPVFGQVDDFAFAAQDPCHAEDDSADLFGRGLLSAGKGMEKVARRIREKRGKNAVVGNVRANRNRSVGVGSDVVGRMH